MCLFSTNTLPLLLQQHKPPFLISNATLPILYLGCKQVSLGETLIQQIKASEQHEVCIFWIKRWPFAHTQQEREKKPSGQLTTRFPITMTNKKTRRHRGCPATSMQSHMVSIHSPHRIRKIMRNEWKKSFMCHRGKLPVVLIFLTLSM